MRRCDRNFDILLPAGCGVWDLSGDLVTRLAGGSVGESQEVGLEWPSLALLFNVRSKSTCTLSLFTPTWLLTSYSCLANK